MMKKTKQNNEFAVFILSYGRSDRMFTTKTLSNHGYSGEIYYVCSTDDPTLQAYRDKFGGNVLTFDKKNYVNTFDIADNFSDMRVVVYARNAVFDIAKQVGVKYFLVLDDDYTAFRYRFNKQLQYSDKKIKSLDEVFSIILEYYKSINAETIALSQGGDFVGGYASGFATRIYAKRKVMNSFFCSTDRPFKFLGRINEDVNYYVDAGIRGKLCFQTNQVSLTQMQTQANAGGLTEFYLDIGTYVKSFYTVIFAPSCTKVHYTGQAQLRLHHKINWNNCAVKIISEQYRKI